MDHMVFSLYEGTFFFSERRPQPVQAFKRLIRQKAIGTWWETTNLPRDATFKKEILL